MSKKFKVWLDSGANIHSMYSVVVSLEELWYTDEEWELLSEDIKEDIMREIAFERTDWGWKEIE